MIIYNSLRRLDIKMLYRFVILSFVLIYAQTGRASDFLNVIVLPDPFSCHQAGVEFKVNKNNTLGVLGRLGCDSNRPTYGSKNDDVDNTFSRLLVPWRYSFNESFKNGFFLQAMAGAERSEFKSTLGSTADVTFVNVALYAGYQWFWNNGFNVSALAGRAFLQEVNSSKTIVSAENQAVSDYLDENTKTNNHGGFGVIVGWLF